MNILLCILFVVVMGVLGRMSGNGFGASFGMKFLPEWLYAIPFGLAAAYAVNGFDYYGWSILVFIISTLISVAGMESATWYFLRWEKHQDPNTTRGGTVKPVVDFFAKLCGYKIGDEGYAWIGAAVKGFIIGLPVGGVITAILWPIGYEIGSHAKGRVEKYGIKDSHAVSEFMSAAGGGLSIIIFLLSIGAFK
jgi:hypothetical protein